jgi:hypothetical protein
MRGRTLRMVVEKSAPEILQTEGVLHMLIQVRLKGVPHAGN